MNTGPSGEPGKPGVDPGLLAAAAAGPAEAVPAGAPGAAPAAPVIWLNEARDIWQFVSSLQYAFPSLAPIYTPETIERLAVAWAPILERHNLTAGRFMIYIVAAGATLPVAVETGRAIRADVRAMKAGKVPAAPAEAAPVDAPEKKAPPPAGDDDAAKPNVPLAPAGEVLDFPAVVPA
jgi:hypothetical protein